MIAGAALAGGAVNAIAGGGSLITFPTLVAVGLPPITASLTNTVAMCPGYFGATYAQRRDLVGQKARALWILPAAATGGVLGAVLLLTSGDRAFHVIVPFLIAFATGVLAMQDLLKRWLLGRDRIARSPAWTAVPVGVAAIYGGYFGAGLGVILLAALALALDDDLIKLNALKQSVALVANVTAALVFVFSGRIDVVVVLAMALASLAGGMIGGALASRVPRKALRWTIVSIGLGISIYYFATL
jgi:uncharacterized membrane protein YfcA